ncbi:uncharacterized protein TRAVEDRAFT_54282 [Trametes versicolor FP-101664 SS1]|uniref:Uncharacterized protein n=1 Tax=Trametes versicolor (strain FP-101664) TaxID=717944 RepID=R7S768_TRAVS|nr:uncharacterized protein TRAVEDRAFT_54282 [Trametes versicolor FP-101664 SS1]EIW51863.1 hypothetical protein TRAVEDRAFT_54282 [Trametes versicolor FP-101664 SS1]
MLILEGSIKALELAKLVTTGLPFPGLNVILDIALSIAKKAKLEVVQEIEDTRDDCRALAERAASHALAVCQQLKDGSGETAEKEHVTAFQHNLQDIENWMARRLRTLRKRDRILLPFRHGKVAKEVKTLTAKLEESYRIFMIQSALSVDQSMNTLKTGNIRMMRHIDDSARVGEVVLGETRVIRTGLSALADRVGGNLIFDGTFRYFARENLAFLEPVADSSYKPQHTDTTPGDDRALAQATAPPRAGRVFCYRAAVKAAGDLTGTQVVVCAYPSRDDQRFVEHLNAAQQTRNPFVLSVLGYSRPGNPCDAAYIVTEADEGEMRVDFELGTGENQTRWSRYKLSCVPLNTTLVFLQRIHALRELSDAASRMVRFLPDPSVTECYAHIGMATHRFYYTETTATMSTHAAEQVVPPLWFFLLQSGGSDSYAHARTTPCGFWSSEKYPTSVPAGIIFDPTPQYEPIRKGEEAPLFTSTQVLGDLVFTTETKMSTTLLQLSEDELLTLRELQESLCPTSKGNASDSDDSGADRFATYDNSDEDNSGDDYTESSGSSNSPATTVEFEPTDSDYQDTTDSEYDSTEEYYSAEEY